MANEKKNQGKAKQENERQRTGEGERQSSQAMQTTGERGGQGQTGIARRQQSAPSLWASGSPFTFMRRFSEEMDRLFEDFGFGRGLLAPSFGRELDRFGEQFNWSPQVEVIEREGQLIVRADLPGMTKDDINVDITDDALIIRGERRNEREENEEGYYRTERSYGSFYRSIPLPEGVNAEAASATFRNGVLEITMPAPERAGQQRRQLEIREGTEGEAQGRGRGKAAGQK